MLNWVPKKIFKEYKRGFVLTPLLSSSLFENVDTFFFIGCVFTVISLLLNQLQSLVYRVINLAFLSLVIVLEWAHNTFLSYIVLVYIIAFIGAIVMLFLSVVLMLPTSLINVVQNGLQRVLLNFAFPCIFFLKSFEDTFDVIIKWYSSGLVFFIYLFLVLCVAFSFLLFLQPSIFQKRTRLWSVLKNVDLGSLQICLQNYLGFNIETEVWVRYCHNLLNFALVPSRYYVILYCQDLCYYLWVNV